jgi:DNA-binding NarL/FixJ family response regulator
MRLDETKGVILAVDDTPDTLALLNEALSQEGYTVMVAMDGQQALNIAKQMLPDLILMDAIMPNLDGFESCKMIKSVPDLVDIPVIFMTGLTESEHVVKGLEAGGVDYICKPIRLDELMARIRVHLNNSRAARSTRSALDEIGQLAFACDINGQFIWSTAKAREFLTSLPGDAHWLTDTMPEQLRTWLSFRPEKHAFFNLKYEGGQVQARFLGHSTPGEFLFRLVDDDVLRLRSVIKDYFQLTEREAEVLLWLSRGKTNREVGQILSMSPRTVNKHLEQVFKKLEVDNRTSAAAACLQYLSQI